MKIIFKSEDVSHVDIIISTDWSFARKILDIIWSEMTIDTFNRKIDEENKKLYGRGKDKFQKIEEKE